MMATTGLHGVVDILGKRSTNPPYYLLEWNGGTSSWEPLKNLNCPRLLLSFEVRNSKRGGSSSLGPDEIFVMDDSSVAVKW